jgi:carbonic anhydrase
MTLPVSLTAATPCAESGQSPVDIRSADLTFVENLPRLRFNYQSRVTLDVENTGSPHELATVRANVPPGAGELRVSGVTYKLLNFHWHTPAEHEEDGIRRPMEMHLVHRAGDENGPLLVVGIWIVSGESHQELNKIFADLPEKDGEHCTVCNFNLQQLLPQNRESYRLCGSLTTGTTPPFDEGVRWIVFAEVIEMSQRQIDAFRELFEYGNSREVQPLNGRTILTDTGDDEHDD